KAQRGATRLAIQGAIFDSLARGLRDASTEGVELEQQVCRSCALSAPQVGAGSIVGGEQHALRGSVERDRRGIRGRLRDGRLRRGCGGRVVVDDSCGSIARESPGQLLRVRTHERLRIEEANMALAQLGSVVASPRCLESKLALCGPGERGRA